MMDEHAGQLAPLRVRILGVPVDDVTLTDALQRVAGWLEDGGRSLHQVVTVNPEIVVASLRDEAYYETLLKADLATPDGIGTIIASRLLGAPLRERVTGVDLVEAIARELRGTARIFLLGAAPGVAERAGRRLQDQFPGTTIAGAWSGSPRDEDADAIFTQLRAVTPNVLLVAFGAPAQDRWIDQHRARLAACGVVVAIGVGGTFDYLAEAVPRAPRIVRAAGFEWLYRLVRQPWRWQRQLALPLFVALVLQQRLRGYR